MRSRAHIYNPMTNTDAFVRCWRRVPCFLILTVSCHFRHPPHVPFDKFPTKCNITQFIYFWKIDLHVSGGISTQHQEHTQLYLQYLVLFKPLLVPAAIVEELELQCISNSSTIAAGSSNGLKSTRYCEYSCVCS